jgi:integrase
MGVYENGGVYWLSYTPFKGAKRVRETTGIAVGSKVIRADGTSVPAKVEAEAILAKIKTQIREGKWFPEARKAEATIQDLHDLWFSREKTKKKVSRKKDEQRFRDGIVAHFGKDRPLSMLGEPEIRAWVKFLESRTTRYGRAPTEATVNRYKALMRSSLRYAKLKGKSVRDDALLAIEIPKENNQRERVCSPEEYRRIIERIENAKRHNPELILAIKIAYGSPLRQGAILDLKWSNVDLKAGVLRLQRVVQGKPRARVVPLSEDAIEALKARPTPINPDTKVFTMTGERCSSAFSYYVKEAKIEDLTFHDLRHTALTDYSNAGVEIIDLAAMSGHKTLSQLQRYVHPDEAKLIEAHEKMQARRKLLEQEQGKKQA